MSNVIKLKLLRETSGRLKKIKQIRKILSDKKEDIRLIERMLTHDVCSDNDLQIILDELVAERDAANSIQYHGSGVLFL
jgi:hypothetical protein